MIKESPIRSLTQLQAVIEGLRGLFPGLPNPCQPAEIWVVSNQRNFAARMTEAVRPALGVRLDGALVNLVPQGDSFPDLGPQQGRINGLWYLFTPDRHEPSSDSFEQWADEHRGLLRDIPLLALKIFDAPLLATWPEPITPDVMRVAERWMTITPFFLDDADAPRAPRAVADLQREFITKFLFKSVKDKLGVAEWKHLADNLDGAVAGALEESFAAVRDGTLEGLCPLDTEILNLRRFAEARAQAASAALLVDEVFDISARLGEVDTTAVSVGALVEELAATLNEERLKGGDMGNWQATETVAFTRDFQKYRTRILLLTDKLIKDFKAHGLDGEAEKYKGVREELSHDITVIMLGGFSSGKSTFLNTLLGLGEGSDPLLTGGKPETATLNVLEYSEKEGAQIKFKNVIALNFFTESEPRPGRVKINRYEMAPFLRWFAAGAIDTGAVGVYRFSSTRAGVAGPYRGGFLKDDRKLFESILASGDTYCDKEWLVQNAAVWRAENIRFTSQPQVPQTTESSRILEFVKNAEIALRTENLLLRRNLPVLTGLRFVDTPGTDSLITHHHTLARAYIEEHPGAPIVYLFDGTLVGSIEDMVNVSFLRSLGADTGRLFFVITKKRRCVESQLDEREIRDKVYDCLRRAGIAGRPVYFVDLLAAREEPGEPEWAAFTGELKEYVDKNRTQLLRAQAKKKIRQPLESLRDSFNAHIEDLRSDGESRKRKVRQLEKKLAALDEVEAGFDAEVKRVRARLYRGKSQKFGEDVDEIIKELKEGDWRAWRTSKKDEQIERMRDLVAPLKEWPELLTKNLTKASDSLVSYLRSELEARVGEPPNNITRKDLSPEYRAFGVTAINDKIGEDQHRYLLSYSDWLDGKAKAVKGRVESAKSSAVKTVDEKFDEMVESYRKQIPPVRDKVRSEFKNLQDVGNTEAAIREKRAHVAFIEECLREFAAIK